MNVIQFAGTEIPVREHATATGIEYTFALTVPATGAEAQVVARIDTRSPRFMASVHVRGVPECLRHRFSDGSLCMWWERDVPERRWVVADGLDELAGQIALHLYREAVCGIGDPWPGDESPEGDHPRPRHCSTCGGEGA